MINMTDWKEKLEKKLEEFKEDQICFDCPFHDPEKLGLCLYFNEVDPDYEGECPYGKYEICSFYIHPNNYYYENIFRIED